MKVTLDGQAAAAAYARAFRRFRELPGFDHQAILRAELASILKTWAGRTKVASSKEAIFRARYRAVKNAIGTNRAGKNPYFISINTGVRGGFPGQVWFRTSPSPRNGGRQKWQQAGVVTAAGYTPAWIHFRSSDWEEISAGSQRAATELARLLPFAEKSVGLARQSVIQIADDLGIDLNTVSGQGISPAGIAKARAAIASNGRAYQNGTGYQGGDGVRFYVQGFTRLPYGAKIGMDRTLAGILSGRAKYIETSYSKGAFDSMRRVAAAFPNFVRFHASPGLN